MWSGITAAAKEAAEDGLSGLERLKRNLQSAAALCQPAGAVAAVYENERETRRASRPPTRLRRGARRWSTARRGDDVAALRACCVCSFDSADLEEEDPDEGVGVDERAALLQPDDFFLDDEDWYASARWVMERPETEDFITAALLSHMAPLYVPYADVRARSAKEVVPSDVQVGAHTASDWPLPLTLTRTHMHPHARILLLPATYACRYIRMYVCMYAFMHACV